MRHRAQDDSAVGEDSFLDTTANLVGILIILVVVIGTKTKLDAEEYGRKIVNQDASAETKETAAEALAMRTALSNQNVKIQEYDFETQYRRLERDAILEKIVGFREKLENALAGVDSEQRLSLESQRRVDQLQAELQDLTDQLGIAEKRERPTIVLEHLPTPMAKTVFNREIHVQLLKNQISVIPWDRLIDALKQHIPLAARRKASRDALDDTLGPLGGFLMHYQMNAIPGGFELEHFELETVPGAPLESLEESLAPSGRLQLELASRDPAETVVTVWVYPDSFETFRLLKTRLFEAGFLTAARPLPFEVRIGASPRGTRSSAQ